MNCLGLYKPQNSGSGNLQHCGHSWQYLALGRTRLPRMRILSGRWSWVCQCSTTWAGLRVSFLWMSSWDPLLSRNFSWKRTLDFSDLYELPGISLQQHSKEIPAPAKDINSIHDCSVSYHTSERKNREMKKKLLHMMLHLGMDSPQDKATDEHLHLLSYMEIKLHVELNFFLAVWV